MRSRAKAQRWLANRYVASFGDLAIEVTFCRTSDGVDGWDWAVWRDTPDEPLEMGRAPTLAMAKGACAKAARRHQKGAPLEAPRP